MHESRIELTVDVTRTLFRVAIFAPSPQGKMVRPTVWRGTSYDEAILASERYASATGLPVADLVATRGVVSDFSPFLGTGAGGCAQDMTELEFMRMVRNYDKPPLDRWRADAVLEPDRKLWGLPMIAEVLGVSIGTARKLARQPNVPIYKPEGAGCYFAFRSELLNWLRSGDRPLTY